MTFLRPEFLYLTPLLAVPVLIHLLNRIRYRVVRWAAIDFLLSSERRAVRRARLRQILLMVLRTLLLAAAVLVLAQPVFRGSLGALLGGSSQVAVAIDSSASMSAGDATGSALDRAKELVAREDIEVAAHVAYIHSLVGDRLRSVYEYPDAAVMCQPHYFIHGVNRAQGVRNVHHGDHFGPLSQEFPVFVKQQFTPVVHGNNPEFGALLLAEHLPGNDV